eukprot:625168-Rhodomonas_salina.2
MQQQSTRMSVAKHSCSICDSQPLNTVARHACARCQDRTQQQHMGVSIVAHSSYTGVPKRHTGVYLEQEPEARVLVG